MDGGGSKSNSRGDQPTTSRRFGWLTQHPSILVAAGASALVTLRLIRTSHGDYETALELLRGGTSSVLVATALLVGPYVLIFSSLGVLSIRVLDGRWPLPVWVFVPTLTLGLATATFPALNLAFVLLVVVGSLIGRRMERQWDKSHPMRAEVEELPTSDEVAAMSDEERANLQERLHAISAVLAAEKARLERRTNLLLGVVSFWLVVSVMFVSDDVWWPTEAITLRDGSILVGYAQDDGRWLRLIGGEDRTVQVIDGNDIESRAVCERVSGTAVPNWMSSSLIALLEGGTEHPACDDLT